MANYEATRYDYSGANITSIEGIPTATIIPWTTASVPSGFLECNGAAVSRSTYAALFAIVGTTYGAGDGSSTFAVPNLQDSANATLTEAQLAAHDHPGGGNANAPGRYFNTTNPTFFAGQVGNGTTGNAGSGNGHSHNMSANFSGDATSVLQPYLTVLYIIKT